MRISVLHNMKKIIIKVVYNLELTDSFDKPKSTEGLYLDSISDASLLTL